MPIIAFLGKTINEYISNALILLSALEFYCPVCGEKMARHSKYSRHIKDKDAAIWIYRFKCKNKSCKKTQAVLPDFIAPHKQYSAVEIESVLLDSIETKPEDIDTPASIATVRRWIRFYEAETTGWISNLKAILLTQTGKVMSELRLSCHFMEQLSVILEELPAIKTSGNVLGAVLIYISAYAIQKFT